MKAMFLDYALDFSSPTTTCTDATMDYHQSDERLTSRPRGWLNWLSLGMLGAGGTADSSQFSGVISDEIVKDIFEATEFHPANSSNGGTGPTVEKKLFLSAICLNIREFSVTLSSKRYDRETACVTFNELSVECKLWEDSVLILSLINSVKMIGRCAENVILVAEKDVSEKRSPEHWKPFISGQIKMSRLDDDSELSIKVILSLNPLENLEARLLSKAE
ncbi:hypothetical protein ACLOJK_006353 [Asimina triloba]